MHFHKNQILGLSTKELVAAGCGLNKENNERGYLLFMFYLGKPTQFTPETKDLQAQHIIFQNLPEIKEPVKKSFEYQENAAHETVLTWGFIQVDFDQESQKFSKWKSYLICQGSEQCFWRWFDWAPCTDKGNVDASVEEILAMKL